ncbi:MAG: amidohydrolase family protein, partial [Candidatus Heimdallarchaeota archaeon]
VGKYADLIVIDADPLTIDEDDIKDINVMLTMVNGKIEYIWASHNFPLLYNTNTSQFGLPLWFTAILIPSIFSIIFVSQKKNKKN